MSADPDHVRAAVLSAGAWSEHSHLPTLLDDPAVEVVGVSSPSETVRTRIAERWPQLRPCSDWASVLDAAPDLVVVSSPPATHEELVVAALASGAHVLVEKPFATDPGSARRMAAAAEAAGRALLVGFSWSSCPAIRAAARWVPELGTVDHVEGRLVVNTRGLLTGSTDGGWGGGVETTSATYTDPALSGGGAGMVSMSHLLSIIVWLTDDPPVELACATFPRDSPVDLHLSLVGRTARGATTSISTVSGQPELDRPEWLLGMYGSRGDLRVDTAHDLAWCAAGGERHEVHDPGAGLVDQHHPTRTAIAVARGTAVPVALSARLAVTVVAVTDAAYRAAASGRWERVEL